jgi:hypothetical protein
MNRTFITCQIKYKFSAYSYWCNSTTFTPLDLFSPIEKYKYLEFYVAFNQNALASIYDLKTAIKQDPLRKLQIPGLNNELLNQVLHNSINLNQEH